MHSHFIANPTLKHLRDDRPARVVWISKVQPVGEVHTVAPVIYLVDELPILTRHAEGRHTRYTIGFVMRSMQRPRGARPSAEGCEIRL